MGDKLVWQSVKWPDGSRYEGLVKGDRCHLRGVFNYANGDRYLGEYVDNNMDGYGVYVWSDGTLYRGQWNGNMMHGCGVKITKQPNGHYIAEEGQFVDDEWAGDVMSCTISQARAAAAEADIAAQMARVFELQPQPVPSAADTKAKSSKKPSSGKSGHHKKVQIPSEIKAAAKAAPVHGGPVPNDDQVPGANSVLDVTPLFESAAQGVETAVKEVQGAWKNVQQWRPDVKLPEDLKLPELPDIKSSLHELSLKLPIKASGGPTTSKQQTRNKSNGKVEAKSPAASPLETFKEKSKEFHVQKVQPMQRQATDFVTRLVTDVKQKLPQLKKSES